LNQLLEFCIAHMHDNVKTVRVWLSIVQPTIDSLSLIDIGESVSVSCNISQGRFGLGTTSGRLLVYDGGSLLSCTELNSQISGIVTIGETLIAATTINGLHAFSDSSKWTLEIESGCEFISASNNHLLVTDGSGGVIYISSEGKVSNREVIGEVNGLKCSEFDDLSAISLTNGTLIVTDENGRIIHESPARDDDAEKISCMVFRDGGVLLVSRESLGMTLDDRFENRIECWHPIHGLIHTIELPSRATTMLPTKFGAIVGCIDGRLLSLEVGNNQIDEVAKFDYSISNIVECGDDFLVSTWFQIYRISRRGEILWSFEHSGFVTQMFSLDNGTIVVIAESPDGSNPAPVILLDPNSSPYLPEESNFDFEEIIQASSDFAGDLSQEEIALANAPPVAISETDDLMHALEEELEIITEEPVVEADLLEDLSSSARAINLPPIADAGDDRTVSANEDDTAIVLLDGSHSYDPDGTIESWAWQNEMDKVIGHTPQIKVKLPMGVHTFKLQVTDNRGASTTSMVTIRIQ